MKPVLLFAAVLVVCAVLLADTGMASTEGSEAERPRRRRLGYKPKNVKGKYLGKGGRHLTTKTRKEMVEFVKGISISKTDFAGLAQLSDSVMIRGGNIVFGPQQGTIKLSEEKIVALPGTTAPPVFIDSATGNSATNKRMSRRTVDRALQRVSKGKDKKRMTAAAVRRLIRSRRDRQLLFYAARQFAFNQEYDITPTTQYVVVCYQSRKGYSWREPYVYKGSGPKETLALDLKQFRGSNIPRGTHAIYVYSTFSPDRRSAEVLLKVSQKLALRKPGISLTVMFNRSFLSSNNTNFMDKAVAAMDSSGDVFGIYQLRVGSAGPKYFTYVETHPV